MINLQVRPSEPKDKLPTALPVPLDHSKLTLVINITLSGLTYKQITPFLFTSDESVTDSLDLVCYSEHTELLLQ